MDHLPDTPMDMSQIMRMAQSPAGKKLISLFKSSDGDEMQQAMKRAADGDYSQAKKAIDKFLSTPEASALVEQLRGK